LEKHSQDPYKFIVAISFPDLGLEKPSPEDLVKMVEQINYEAGAAFLARLNFYLSLAHESRNAKKIIEVQEKLSHDVLSPARLQEIVKIFGNRRLYENYVLLNRAQLLVGIKLLAIYGRQEGGNCLETEADRATIGELALAINSFYGPGLGEPNWPLKDVIVQMAASAELYNSETFVNGLVRTRCLLGPILRDHTARLKGRNLPPPFERIFTLLNGLNFRDFLDITLYLLAEQCQMLTETMEADAMAYADVTAPKRYVSGKSLKAWAELMAVDLDDLRPLVHGSERDPAFFFDFTIFRRFPLWRSGDHKYFCIDGMFLSERLSSYGIYWTIVNGLVDETLRSHFQRVWGELIQEYVRQLIDDLFRDQAGTFARKPVYCDDGTEVFDSAIVMGDSLLPIEIKSSILPVEQKYAGEAGPFYQGLSAKFGTSEGAAVEQLLRNIAQVFSAAHPRGSASIPAGQIRHVFPIVVVHEPILRFGIAAGALAGELVAGLSGLALRSGLEVYPLQLLAIDELERLEPYIRDKDFPLVECLRSKVSEDPHHRMGLWQFMTTRFLPARGIEPKPNAKLLGRFDWLRDAQSWRVYRGDYYDHSLASRGEPSKRAIICARPMGGDELLWDEVIAFREYASAEEAYKAIRELRDKDFPKQKISADWFECAVVDEFGFLLADPS
jgi:hypothetical protein